VALLTAFTVLAVAVVTDVRERRIPNAATLPGFTDAAGLAAGDVSLAGPVVESICWVVFCSCAGGCPEGVGAGQKTIRP